jgi:hypothetical protein
MARAEWYCKKCETYGGGPPNEMTMCEHIDYAHEASIVKMEEV